MKFTHWVKLAIVVLFIFGIVKYCHYVRANGYYASPTKQTRISDIYSINLYSAIKGSFVLGVGTIDSEEHYVFYRKTASGGFVRDNIKCSMCILYEGYSDKSQPRLIEIGTYTYHLIDGDTVSNQFSRDEFTSVQSLYIPKGTITEKININL